jgi:hypothetical protein
MTAPTVQCGLLRRAETMEGSIRPLDRDRLSVLMAVLLLGSLLFRFIELPEAVWRLEPLGSPLEIRVTGVWLLVTLMVGVVCTGTNLILHGHPHLGKHPGRPIYISWILPGVMAGLSAYLLEQVTSWPVWVGGLLLVGIGISLVIAAEYAVTCPDASGYPVARLALNMLAYLLIFVLFALIYRTRTRSLVTATLLMGVAGLFALDLLSIADVPFMRVLPLAGIVGLIVGEATWAMNYWLIQAWAGGLLLLLIFYVTVNVAHQYLLERLRISILVEFAVVAVVVLAVVFLRAS